MKLHQLHVALLWTMGWAGGHLHEFIIGHHHYGEPDPDFDMGPPLQRENRFTLASCARFAQTLSFISTTTVMVGSTA